MKVTTWMRFWFRSCVVGGVIFGAHTACAVDVFTVDAPTLGLLYNTKESQSLVYHCTQDQSGVLQCDFTQTAVRKKASPKDLESNLQRVREVFRSGTKIPTDDCKTFKEWSDILEGRKKSPKEEILKEKSDMQKKDFLELNRALLDVCSTKSEESVLKVVRLEHSFNARTCLVSANTYKQSFRLVHDDLSDRSSWVTQGSPEGPCGIVQISRFEPDYSEDSKRPIWNYVAQKAITNPQGTLTPGVSCKALDQAEYLYDWKSKTHTLGCDYIEFSPL